MPKKNNKEKDFSSQDPNNIGFNPSLKEFLIKNPKISLLGIAWACYWRLMCIIGVITFFLYLMIA